MTFIRKRMHKGYRRTVSVFLCVLMLLTAWVFVEPDAVPKASAITSQSAGTYGWRITCYSRNDTGGWNYEHLKVYGKSNNGTGSEELILQVDNWKVDFKGWRENTFGRNDQWGYSQCPTRVVYEYSFGGGWTQRTLDFDLYLDVYDYNSSSWTNTGSMSVYSSDGGTNSGSKSMSCAVPQLQVGYSGAASVNSNGTATSDYSVSSAKDQFGVNWGFSSINSWTSSNGQTSVENSGRAHFGFTGQPPANYSTNLTVKLNNSNGTQTTAANSKSVSVSFSAASLALNTDYSPNIPIGGGLAWYSYTPSSTEKYTIFSHGSSDTRYYCYKGNTSTSFASNDDGPSPQKGILGLGSTQFYQELDLTSGTTYYFAVRWYSSSTTGSFPFQMRKGVKVAFFGTGGTFSSADSVVCYLPGGYSTMKMNQTGVSRSDHTLIAWSGSGNGAQTKTCMASETLTVPTSEASYYALWNPSNPTVLSLNTDYNAQIASGGQVNFYKYTPTTAGHYVFYGKSSTDTYGIRYVPSTWASSATVASTSDDQGISALGQSSNQFRMQLDMTANTEYMFGAKYYNATNTGTIPFRLEPYYIVKYDMNNGTGSISNQDKYYDRTLTLSSTVPTRTAYDFLGWSTSSTATAATYPAGGSYTDNADANLYAVWKATNYTIKYDMNGDNAINDTVYTIENAVTLPSPTRTGYTFDKWKVTSAEGNWTADATFDPGEALTGMYGNVTMQAQWIPHITATLNKNNGTGGTGVVYYKYQKAGYYSDLAATASIPSVTVPSRDGFDFDGYYADIGGTNTQLITESGAFSTNPHLYDQLGSNNAITLNAQWTPRVITATLDKQTGTGGTSTIYYKFTQDGYYSDSAASVSMATVEIPTRPGYDFNGYYSSANGTGQQYVLADGSFSEDFKLYNQRNADDTFTIYAQWIPQVITAIFDKDNGTGGTDTVYYRYQQTDAENGTYFRTANLSSKLESIEIPSRTGYDFGGYWSLPGDGGVQYIDASGAFTDANLYNQLGTNQAIALYAKWIPHVIQVSLDRQTGNGGTGTLFYKFEQNDAMNGTYFATNTSGVLSDKITSVVIPAKVGYTFEGYFSEPDGAGTRYIDGNGAFTDANLFNQLGTDAAGTAMTLYANWTQNTYGIAFGENTTGQPEETAGGDEVTITVTPNTDYHLTNNVTVTVGETTLTQGTDYTFSFGARTSTITIAENLIGDDVTVTVAVEACSGGTANCTDKAVCTTCGAAYGETNDDHDFGTPSLAWTDDGHSCTATRVCSRDSRHFETEVATVENGKISSAKKSAPTCEDKGVTTYTATFENTAFETASKDVADVDALGHIWQWAIDSDPTCTTDGVKHQVCTREGCGAIQSINTPIEKLGHNMTAFEAHAQSCTEAGNSAYWYCDRCKKYFSDAEGETEIEENGWVIQADGHTDAAEWSKDEEGHWKVCAVCGVVTVEKAQHTFGDWVDDGNGEHTKTCECGYATTEKISYTLSFDANGGEGAPESVGKTYGTPVTLPAAEPTFFGHTFEGWLVGEDTYDSGDQVETDYTTTDGDTVTLVAQWTADEYAINYDLDGGSADGNPTTYTIETDTFTLNNPEKLGYTFAGWTGTGLEGAAMEVTVAKGSSGERSYTATWTPEEYAISYELGGGTNNEANPGSYTIETATFTLADPTRVGYTFTGWSGTDIDGTSTSVTVTVGSTGARAYTANWEKIPYTASFDSNGGDAIESLTYYVDSDPITLPENPTRNGCDFTGWTVKTAEGSWTVDSPATEIPTGSYGNVTFKATWDLTEYTITYNLGGGENAAANPASYTVDTETFTLAEPTRTGYTFTGWTGSNGETPEKVVTIEQGSFSDLTYTANWATVPYTATFVTDGTPVEAIPFNIESDTITLPTNTSKDAYEFTGWTVKTAEGCWTVGATVTEIAAGSYGDVTFEANWTPVNFGITYVLDGGTNAEENPAKYNIETETFTLAAPTKAGYNFTGWTGSNGETPELTVEIAKGSTGALTYTAHWAPITYTVVYDLNGGDGEIGSFTKTYGVNAVLSDTVPTKRGHDFAVWKIGEAQYAAGATMDQDFTTTDGDTVTLTANWSKGNYNVVYEGSVVGDQTKLTGLDEATIVITPTSDCHLTTVTQVKVGTTVLSIDQYTALIPQSKATATVIIDADVVDDTVTITVGTTDHSMQWYGVNQDVCQKRCSVCGAIEIESAAHELSAQWLNAGDGEHHYKTCARCETQVLVAHSGGTATCTAQSICEDCGAAYGALAPHALDKIDAVEAKCTAEGAIEYWVCGSCHQLFKDAAATEVITIEETVLPKIPHDFTGSIKDNKNGTHSYLCTYGCGIYGGAVAHTYDKQVQSEAYYKSSADCLSPAVYYVSCACGAKGSATFDGGAIGHNYVAKAGTPATCLEAGVTDYEECSRCGDVQGKQTIQALGHGSYLYDSTKSGKVYDGTFEWSTYSCSRGCGDHYVLFTVYAKDNTAKGVEGARVTISGGGRNASGVTDSNGVFACDEHFKDGEYKVSIEYKSDDATAATTGDIRVIDGRSSGGVGTLRLVDNTTPSDGGNNTTPSGSSDGFRCSMCDSYEANHNQPVIGVFYTIIHFFVHLIQRILYAFNK